VNFTTTFGHAERTAAGLNGSGSRFRKALGIASILAALSALGVAAQLPPAGYALSFNGVNQSVNFGTVLTAIDNFSIEAWVNPATTTGTSAIVYNGDTSFNGWGIYQVGNQFEALYGGVTLWGAASVTTNVWQHVALVSSGGVATLYLNGVPASISIRRPSMAIVPVPVVGVVIPVATVPVSRSVVERK